MLGDFEEDRKPNIEYLDSLNEHKKRSRSLEEDAAEVDGAAERKLARVVGWDQGQAANGDVEGGSGVAGAAAGADVDVDGDAPPEDDPTVFGLSFFFLHAMSVLTRPLQVDGKPMPFSQVEEEHHELMTADEWAAYFEIFQQRSS